MRKRGQNSGKKYIDYDRILGRANGSDTNERRWILIAQYWFRLSCLEHHFIGEFGRRAEPRKNDSACFFSYFFLLSILESMSLI